MFKYIVPNQIIIGISPMNQIVRWIDENQAYQNILIVCDQPLDQFLSVGKKLFTKLVHHIQKNQRKVVIVNVNDLATIKFEEFNILIIAASDNTKTFDLVNQKQGKNALPCIRINVFLDDHYLNWFFAMNHLLLSQQTCSYDQHQSLITACIYPFKKRIKPNALVNKIKSMDDTKCQIFAFIFLFSIYRIANDKNIHPILKANYLGCINAFTRAFNGKKDNLRNWYEAQKLFYLGFNNDIDAINKLTSTSVEDWNNFFHRFNQTSFKKIDEYINNQQLLRELKSFNIDFNYFKSTLSFLTNLVIEKVKLM